MDCKHLSKRPTALFDSFAQKGNESGDLSGDGRDRQSVSNDHLHILAARAALPDGCTRFVRKVAAAIWAQQVLIFVGRLRRYLEQIQFLQKYRAQVSFEIEFAADRVSRRGVGIA